MKKVYIVEAKRTAMGSFLGTLTNTTPAEMGGAVIKDILANTSLNGSELDEVIIGNVLPAGQGQGIGRQVAIAGGVPVEVPAYTLNIICGSGMKSVLTGFSAIKSGEANLIIAGGVESMSQSKFVPSANVRTGQKMGDFKMVDTMVNDALTDAFNGYHMGVTAENIVEKYNITREAQDKLAASSQEKAIAAVDSGRFNDEIVPLEIKSRRETITFDKDEYPNRRTNFEKLSSLRAVFKKDGTVTAGNASGINDGASMILLASEEAVEKYNLTPMLEVVAVGQGGVDPSVMGMGPVPAINNALKKADLELKDMDLIELNEAFAAQAIGVMTELSDQHEGVELDWFEDKTNVNGGAIALGHPVGASGNRIITTLVHEMKKRESNLGLASLCIGGGMGTAVVLKKITK